MTYNPSIPQAGDLISASQSQILTNFNQANTLFGIDHVTFDDATALNRGKHNKSTYVEQTLDPATAFNEMDIYSKDVGGNTTLFYRKENNGTVMAISGQDPIRNLNGSSFLPGDSTTAVIMKWGTTGIVGDNAVVNFASAFPNSCFGVILTIIDPNATSKTINVKTGSITPTNFTVRVSVGNVTAFYLAIGF